MAFGTALHYPGAPLGRTPLALLMRGQRRTFSPGFVVAGKLGYVIAGKLGYFVAGKLGYVIAGKPSLAKAS